MAQVIAALQIALADHSWPAYPTVGGSVALRCNCGADIRTASAWLEHIKSDVIPQVVHSLGLK